MKRFPWDGSSTVTTVERLLVSSRLHKNMLIVLLMSEHTRIYPREKQSCLVKQLQSMWSVCQWQTVGNRDTVAIPQKALGLNTFYRAFCHHHLPLILSKYKQSKYSLCLSKVSSPNDPHSYEINGMRNWVNYAEYSGKFWNLEGFIVQPLNLYWNLLSIPKDFSHSHGPERALAQHHVGYVELGPWDLPVEIAQTVVESIQIGALLQMQLAVFSKKTVFLHIVKHKLVLH